MPDDGSRPFRFDPRIVRAVRESRGITREQLAVRLGYSVAVIAQFELGYRVPSLTKAAEFADALGIRLDDLLAINDTTAVAQ